MNAPRIERRELLRGLAAASLGFPAIVPASVFGQDPPSRRIQVGQLGCGRIGRTSEIPGVLRHPEIARFVAVCDLDAIRLEDGRKMIEDASSRRSGKQGEARVKAYRDYREMLADPSIDAICISTPDHWHAQPAMEAALAGKDIYLQKPASLTIREGRQMADVIRKTGRILQIGSQQRSGPQFRLACELVRNGRIGKIQTIEIGLPVDPSGPDEPRMPVPSNLDYDAWLGSTPGVYYTEARVHPQSADPARRYDRPGWLRCEQFGAGMITGWGAHHVDIAHWGMGLEHSGPVEVKARAEFPRKGLWDVHGPFRVEALYSNGARLVISDQLPNGIKFVGEEGWIWVTRGNYPEPANSKATGTNRPLDASDRRILDASLPKDAVRLHNSPKNDHHLDWLVSIRDRKPPAAPAEDGHRSCTACLLGHAAMKLGRTLRWDPETESFPGDGEANRVRERPQRSPYGTNSVVS
ncbi:MAG: Gfo/Idh/MocA family oxidoreductase [Isosphaeraceae bacterium]